MCFKLSHRRPELFTGCVPKQTAINFDGHLRIIPSCIFNDEQMRCFELRPKNI